MLVKFILLVLQYFYFDGEGIDIWFEPLVYRRMMNQPYGILLRSHDKTLAFQGVKAFRHELHISLGKLMVIAES